MKQGIKNGSFGIWLDSLRKVRQAKEFAKATKVDDAEIHVYLWDKRVEGVNCEVRRDKARIVFRKIGMRMFLKVLRGDSTAYLVQGYGKDWYKKPRRQGEKLMPLGRDQHANHEYNLAYISLKLV